MSEKLVVVIVTGGRKYGDLHNYKTLSKEELIKRTNERRKVIDTLSSLADQYSVYHNPDDSWLPGDFEIVEGDAWGADACAADWATDNYTKHKQFPPDIAQYGSPAAFFIRNQAMADYGRQMQDKGHTVIVVAFPGNNGTADMVKRAKRRELEVIEVE